MEIHLETAEDIAQIFTINEVAFGRPEEALLVDRLRAKKAILYSLVAVEDGRLIGHALYSPVLIHGDNGVVTVVVGLGPIAVSPAYQKQGVGGELIRAGMKLCREAGYRLMIVLGHPEYYPRFGFQQAGQFGITSAYKVPEDVFMVLALEDGALEAISGVAHYHREFDGV